MIFSLAWILTNFKKCCLQLSNLKTLIFVNKNQLNDPKIDYKPLSNLVELIQKDLDFEEELQNLKVLFSWMNFKIYKMLAKFI